MSEQKENSEMAIELARSCKSFADKTCHEWREDTQPEGADWRDAKEMRELYFNLQVLRHSSEVVLQRVGLLKDRLETELVPGCDKYGHSVGDKAERFPCRWPQSRTNMPLADRFGHIGRSAGLASSGAEETGNRR